MNGLTAKLKKNDNKGIFTQLGITGNDVTSRDLLLPHPDTEKQLQSC